MKRTHFVVLLTVLLVNLAGCGGTTDPSVATTVTLSPTTLSFSSLGDTQELTATVRDQDGATINGASVTWESLSSSIASVSPTGLVEAVANGTTTITVTSGSASETASVTVTAPANAEMIAITGTWLVQTWTITQVAAPMTVVSPFVTAPVGRPDPIDDATLFLYDDGTLLSIFNYPDTLRTNSPPPPDEIFLDASEYPVNTWCVALAADVSFCEGAAADELIIDPGDTDEQIWTFARTGDDMTLTGGAGVVYDFGAGDEPATFMMTLDRVLIDYNRPQLSTETPPPRRPTDPDHLQGSLHRPI